MSHVVIVGAGPAGACLACLLVQRGVHVTLVERRHDFAREFRGEILMPSGIQALQEMGLAHLLQAIAHHAPERIALYMNRRRVFDLPLEVPEMQGRRPLAISQPAFLEGVVKTASQAPGFELRRGTAVRSLIEVDGRVRGVTLRCDDGEQTLAADLVVGCDGRNSAVRRHLGIQSRHMNPPMDIVWCKLPCPPDWPGVEAYAGRGHLLVAYRTWDGTLQLGWVILKGTFAELRSQGIQAWVDEMANHVAPAFANHLRAHSSDATRPFLLQSLSDRVEHWSARGALLISDAAHTMSPVGGQGVNIALRDAIVAANHLVPVLRGTATPDPEAIDRALAAIEVERLPEVEPIQDFQAQPPKLVLSRAWWGEPLRRIAAALVSLPAVRARIGQRVAMLTFGVTDVRLRV